jgi:hypothetical protein
MARLVAQITTPEVMSTKESTNEEIIESDPEKYDAKNFAIVKETLISRVILANKCAFEARPFCLAASMAQLAVEPKSSDLLKV